MEAANAKTAGNGQTLAQWCRGIRIAQIAHLRAAAGYQRLHRLLGVPVTVLTALVSTSIFASMGESKREGMLIAAGIISVLTAILSGVQTFLNYTELSVKHQEAGTKYGKLRRRVDEVMAVGYADDKLEALLKEVREAWDKIEAESPPAVQRYVDQARKMVGTPTAGDTLSASQ